MNDFDRALYGTNPSGELGYYYQAAKAAYAVFKGVKGRKKAKKAKKKAINAAFDKLGIKGKFPATPGGVMEKWGISPNQFYSLPVTGQKELKIFAKGGVRGHKSRIKMTLALLNLATSIPMSKLNVTRSLTLPGPQKGSKAGAMKKYWLTSKQYDLVPSKKFINAMASFTRYKRTKHYLQLLKILESVRKKSPSPKLIGFKLKVVPPKPPPLKVVEKITQKEAVKPALKEAVKIIVAAPEVKQAIQTLQDKGKTGEQIKKLIVSSEVFKQVAEPIVIREVVQQYQQVLYDQGYPDWEERGIALGTQAAEQSVKQAQNSASGMNMVLPALAAVTALMVF